MTFLIKKIYFVLSVLIALTLLPITAMAVGAATDSPPKNNRVNTNIAELEFKEAKIQNAMRVISELTRVNIVVTRKASKGKLTIYIRDISVREAIDSICRVSGLWYRYNRDTNVFIVMTTEEYFKDVIVFRQESTKVFTLRYQNVIKVGRLIEAMFGSDRVELDLQDDFEDDLTLPGGVLSQSRGGSSNNNSNGGNQNNIDNSRRNNNKDKIDEMTSSQIALLEQANKGKSSLLLSEKRLAGVRKSANVPIFVSVNREHNLLFVRTVDDKALEEINRMVLESDRPTPQVLLEMKVMTITMEDDFKSAFDFSFNTGPNEAGPPDGQPTSPYDPLAVTVPATIGGFLGDLTTTSNALIFQLINDNIRARMDILQTEGRVNILATPMLLASNNRPAKIFIGIETPITTGFTTRSSGGGEGSSNTYISVPVPETEVEEIGNTLTILPSINSDRTVMMRLLQEASRAIKNGTTIPIVTGLDVVNTPIDIIQKSTLEGTVMAKDGLTVMVGGMVTETKNIREEKVPVLGDIPLLGYLFRKNEEVTEKEELVLLITPHVFTTPEEAEAVSRQRISALGEPGDSVNIYLDNLSKTRLQTEKGQIIDNDINEISTPLVQPRSSGPEQSYIDLTRVAVRQVRIPFAKRWEENGICPLPFNGEDTIHPFINQKLQTVPVAEWSDGRFFVSACIVRNQSNKAVSLAEETFNGHWLAMTIEKDKLDSAGSLGDSTYLYLISDKPLTKTKIFRKTK